MKIDVYCTVSQNGYSKLLGLIVNDVDSEQLANVTGSLMSVL